MTREVSIGRKVICATRGHSWVTVTDYRGILLKRYCDRCRRLG